MTNYETYDSMSLLLNETKKANRRKMILIILLIAILAALVVIGVLVVPKALETMNMMKEMQTAYGPTLEKAKIFFDTIDEEQITGLSESVNRLSEVINTIGSWFN